MEKNSKYSRKIKKFVKKVKVEHLFVVIAILWGLVLVFLVPPFQVPDEESHYYKAVAVSNGDFLCDEGMISVHQENIDFVNAMNPNAVVFNPEAKFDRNLFSEYEDSGDRTIQSVQSPLCSVMPFPHFVPAMGIFTADVVGASPMIGFYVARVLNLILAVTLLYVAIKLFMEGRNIIIALGLLPMSIFLFASLNYDAFFIPLVILLVAFVFKLIWQDRKATVSEIAILIVLSILVATTKLGFISIILISLILISKKLFSKWWYGMIVVAGTIILSLGCVLVYQSMSPGEFLPEWVDTSGQISHILSQPDSYLVTLLRTAKINGWFYIKSTVGVFGWLDYGLSVFGYISLFIVFVSFILLEKYRKFLDTRQMVIITGVVILTFLMILTGMYIYSSHLASAVVEGAQGRYFIPLLFPILVVLGGLLSWKIPTKYRNVATLVAILGLLIVIFDMIIRTVMRYYG